MSEWRTLGPEDILQEGDEWSEKGKAIWNLVNPTCFGNDIGHWDRCYDFRRRVSPVAKDATTDKESLTVAVCPQCGHEDGWHNIECWKQRAEKAEEGFKFYLGAWEQVEKERAELKKVLMDPAALWVNMLRGAVPMIAEVENLRRQLEQAEKERDEARRSFADYIERTDLALDAIGVLNRDEVGRIGPYNRTLLLGKERDQLRAENERLRKELKHWEESPKGETK